MKTQKTKFIQKAAIPLQMIFKSHKLMNKRTLIILSACLTVSMTAQAQRSLGFYVEQAERNSPLLGGLNNEKEKNGLELQRLHAAISGVRLQADGGFIFAPVVSNDNGHTSLEWNSPTPQKYFGYDTGQRNSELRAGVTLSKPLLNGAAYRAERDRINAAAARTDYDISLNRHEIERIVTDQYLLCLLDASQVSFIDSLKESIRQQHDIVKKMAERGLCKLSDVRLLAIELLNDSSRADEALRTYRSHLAELNIMCGVKDTATVKLSDIDVELKPSPHGGTTRFAEQYRLDSLALVAGLRSFESQYRPQLSLFVDGGLNTADINKTMRRFGASAGLTFTWLFYDGKQKRNRERQTQLDLNTNALNQADFMRRRALERQKYMAQIADSRRQEQTLMAQISEYDRLAEGFLREARQGDVSVTTYITAMRNRLQAMSDLLTLRTNIKLMINALNYWNW